MVAECANPGLKRPLYFCVFDNPQPEGGDSSFPEKPACHFKEVSSEAAKIQILLFH